MSTDLLTLTNAGFQYGSRPHTPWIFRNLDLEVAPGEILAILGCNGVGKSTLLNTLIGLLPLTEGKICLGGRELSHLGTAQRARHIAYLPQMQGSSIAYTVTEYLLMGRAPYIGMFASPRASDRARVTQILKELDITDLAQMQLDRLSGGQRQQVGIGRALVQDAPFIVLDEPTSALDLANQAKVLRKLRELRANGYGVIFTTHNPDHALLVEANVALLGASSTYLSPPQDRVEHQGHPARLLTGKACEVLTSEILSSTFNTELHVTYSSELQRKTVQMTGIS